MILNKAYIVYYVHKYMYMYLKQQNYDYTTKDATFVQVETSYDF